jgi:AAA+ superfamily predicted ATPase
LDEADVYIRQRGDDLEQNAMVGVFLRTLEYYAGVMFMTTNKPESVDDAIASRCIARVTYAIPNAEDQEKIWKALTDTAKVKIEEKEMKKILEKHMSLSGRDIKNLLKLAIMISMSKKVPITAELINIVKRFKPTIDEIKQGEK